MIKVKMLKVKSFFKTFKNSLIPHYPFYHTIHTKKLRESFMYFLILIAVLNILLIVTGVVRLNPAKMKNVFTNVINSLNTYPRDLSIFINNGNLLTTHNRPYFLWLDHNDRKYLIAAVDKMADSTSATNYNAFLLLDSHNFFYKKGMGEEYVTVPLKIIGEHTITSNTITQVKETMQTIERYFIVFYIGAVLTTLIILPILSLITTLLYVILASSIAYLIFFMLRPGKKPYIFKTIFQLALYAVTLPLILDYVLSVFHIHNDLTPFLFLFLLIAFVMGAVHEAHYKPSNT